jgi:hypothetical protein
MEANAMSILDWYEVIGITLLLGERAVGYYQKYRQSRFVEPKLQTQRVFLEQANWFEERAQKLAAFHWQLRNTKPDKFKLAELVSKLDRHDQQCAMKETDIDVLSKWAEQRGRECHDNASETSRLAVEMGYRILAD